MAKRSTCISARRGVFGAAVLAAICAFAGPAFGQLNDKMTPIPVPDQPTAIEIGTGPLPDAKAQESWHSQYGSKFARNVTVATIPPFLPDRARASSGAAVVVAPGGGYPTKARMLSAGHRVRVGGRYRGAPAGSRSSPVTRPPSKVRPHAPCHSTTSGLGSDGRGSRLSAIVGCDVAASRDA